MKEDKIFGARLRELRTQAGFTLRELADKVDINFTYLSKIENGALPPPSEKVIRKLAETLNVDKDNLLAMAGVIPPDIAEMLKDGDTLKKLRAELAKKKGVALTKKQEAVNRFDDSKNLPKSTKTHKNFTTVAVAIILAILVGTLLWFAVPNTDTAVAVNNQGVIYNNNGEYYKAIAAFNNAIELDPGLALAHNNRGWAYIELGQYEQGIADCNNAIELDPGLALAYSNRGLAYIRLGQYDQGIDDCNKAIELDPFLALAYSNRGLAYIELEQYEQAIADFDKAMELDPNLQKQAGVS